jgi:hypothetical protein
MATHSTIAIQNQDGTVTGTYCHSDGYLEYNGRILYNHYTTEEIVRELISFGQLSSLGIGIYPDPNEEHNFYRPQEDVCRFYGRDRGETGVEPETYDNWEQMLGLQGQVYNYLFVPGEGWHVSHSSSVSKLSDVFRKEIV